MTDVLLFLNNRISDFVLQRNIRNDIQCAAHWNSTHVPELNKHRVNVVISWDKWSHGVNSKRSNLGEGWAGKAGRSVVKGALRGLWSYMHLQISEVRLLELWNWAILVKQKIKKHSVILMQLKKITPANLFRRLNICRNLPQFDVSQRPNLT